MKANDQGSGSLPAPARPLPSGMEAPDDFARVAWDLCQRLYDLALRTWPAGDDQLRAVNWLLIDLYEHCWLLAIGALGGRNSAASSLQRLIQERWECALAASLDKRFAGRYQSSATEGTDSRRVRARAEDAQGILAKALHPRDDEARRRFHKAAADRKSLMASMFVHPSAQGPGLTIVVAVHPESPGAALHYVGTILVLAEALAHGLDASGLHPAGREGVIEGLEAVRRASAYARLKSTTLLELLGEERLKVMNAAFRSIEAKLTALG